MNSRNRMRIEPAHVLVAPERSVCWRPVYVSVGLAALFSLAIIIIGTLSDHQQIPWDAVIFVSPICILMGIIRGFM